MNITMKKLKPGLHASLCLVTLTSITLTSASQASPVVEALQDEIQWLQEETYITTATKTQEKLRKSGATVTVITEQELNNMGARNLMDALKRIPGIGIHTNSLGHPVIEMRGVKTDFSEKVLFLVNGHAINNNIINGGATWTHHEFMVDDIQQVEIVRGPGSALYGANAFAGVINIITKKAEHIQGNKLGVSLGENQTRKLNFQTGQTLNELSLALNASIYETDGHRETVTSDMWQNSGPTDDWNKRIDLSFNADYAHFSFQGKYTNRKSGPYIGFGNALNDESEQTYEEYFLELGYQQSLSEKTDISHKLYFNTFKTDNTWEVHPEGFPSPFHTDGMVGRSPITAEILGTEVQIDYVLGRHKFIVGLMAEHQSIFDVGFFANFDPTNGAPLSSYQNIYDSWPWIGSEHRDIQALYLQDIWDINSQLRLILGARYDHYSDVGDSFNPRASLSWSATADLSLFATYGAAFRAPNFGELYNANNPGALGNPDLNPEEIETYELGLHNRLGKRSQFRGTLFYNNITDLIDFRNIVASNVGKLTVSGVELELDTRLADGSIFDLNYTYQYGENEETGKRLKGIPNHKANASYYYRHSQYFGTFFGINHTGQVKRSSEDPRTELKDFTTVDVAMNIKSQNHKLDLNISIYNLFNEAVKDATRFSPAGYVNSDFPLPGRSFMIEANVKL